MCAGLRGGRRIHSDHWPAVRKVGRAMSAQSIARQLTPAQLKSYIDGGILKVTMRKPLPMCIEDTEIFHTFKHLAKKGIGLGEAARKYNVPQPTISRWKDKGFIPVIGKSGAQKILLSEAYVAYCAEVYHRAPGKGRWAFNKNGTPRLHGTNLRKP